MKIVKSDAIENALMQSGRTYLCGDLEKVNGVAHIHTSAYEMGISYYKNYTFEKAHLHQYNQEFNYVIVGAVKVFLLNEKKEVEFHTGDLFCFESNEPYVGKILEGTRIFFTKVPGGNDKKLVEMNESLMHWGSSWDSVYE